MAYPSGPVLVPVSNEDTNPLILVCGPSVVAETFTFTVHVPPAAIVPSVNDSEEPDAAGLKVGVPHPEIPTFGVPETSTPEGSESVNCTLVISIVFGLSIVKVKVEVPFTGIEAGEKTLLIVGGAGIAQPVKEILSSCISAPLDSVFAPSP